LGPIIAGEKLNNSPTWSWPGAVRINLALIGLNIMLSAQKKKKTQKRKKPKSATPIKKGQDGKRNSDRIGNENGTCAGTRTRLAKCGTFSDATVLGLISGFHAIAEKKCLTQKRWNGPKDADMHVKVKNRPLNKPRSQ